MIDGNFITQMKLQKLVYFAHGIHLAQYSVPLISDPVQAWQYGPVVPRLYQEYKLYGSAPIVDLSKVITRYTDADLDRLDPRAKLSVDQTWAVLKTWTAAQLSSWTHAEGSPWEMRYSPYEADIQIKNEEMAEYFKRYLIPDA